MKQNQEIKESKQEDERVYCVYMHKCLINGKVYIGTTSQVPERRWDSGYGYRSNRVFNSDIKAYGWNDGFTHEVLFENLTAEEAIEKETELIAKYNATDPQNGYNIVARSVMIKRGWKHSDETKRKLSEINKGKTISEENKKKTSERMKGNTINKGRALSEDTKKKLSEINLGKTLSAETRKKISEGNKGKHTLSEEHKRKLLESNLGHTLSEQAKKKISEKNSKPVYCEELDQVFKSASDASRQLGLCRRSITHCCRGKQKTAGKMHFRYAESNENTK